MPQTKGYSGAQILLHWIIAVLILLPFLFNEPIGAGFRAMMRGEVPAFDIRIWAHIAAGIVILALVVWRLTLRIRRGVPPVPEGARALKLAAHIGHWVLYALMVLLPISGLAAWFGGIGAAGNAHSLMTTLLLIVVGVHVLAALWHQFWLKDRLLLRMMRPDA